MPSRQPHRVTSGRSTQSPFFHTSWKTPVRKAQRKRWIPVLTPVNIKRYQVTERSRRRISQFWHFTLLTTTDRRWGTVSATDGRVRWCDETHGSWAVQIKTQGVSQQRTKQPVQHWIPVQSQYRELGHQKTETALVISFLDKHVNTSGQTFSISKEEVQSCL